MQKPLLLIVLVFSFVYLHKLQKLFKRDRVQTYCNSFEHNGQKIHDCVACINTQKIPSPSLKFYINNINDNHEEIDFHGTVRVLKQQKCLQYSCASLLNTSDYQMKASKNILQDLTFSIESNRSVNSKESQVLDLQLGNNQVAVSLRFRLIQRTKANTTMFVTVRYPHQDITERLAISLSGTAISGINYLMLLAFLPGLQGIMQAYMVYKMLISVIKHPAFPIIYAATYFVLSHLTNFQIYRNMYFLCNILLSVITGVLAPSKESIISIIITVICVSSEYAFMTKDLVWTSTIVGYYLNLIQNNNNKDENEVKWSPIQV